MPECQRPNPAGPAPFAVAFSRPICFLGNGFESSVSSKEAAPIAHLHPNLLNIRDIAMVMQLHYHTRVSQWDSYRDHCSRDFCR